MSVELTRTYLIQNKFRVDFDEEGYPLIYRFGKLRNGGAIDWHLMTPTLCITHHRYGNDCKYYNVSFIDKKGKRMCIPVARLVMAWMNNIVPANFDVDHIDGNSLNNKLDNLQIITRRENLAKRLLNQSEIGKRVFALKKMERDLQEQQEEPYEESDILKIYEDQKGE